MTRTGIKKAWWLMLTVLAISLLTLSFACGGDDDDDDDDDDNGTPAATTPAANGNGNGNGGEVSFDVSTGDNFFEPSEFTVPAGATVTFNLTNGGDAIHNMRIFGASPAVSDPDLITAGEAGTLEWTAPSDPGEYDFLCDFHPTDMLGTITVE